MAANFHSPKLEEAARELQEKDIQVEIFSENLSYNNNSKTYTATSYVEIKYGKFHLTADRATFNNQTGDVLAEGNVVLDEEDSRITGDRIVMNIKTKQGEIENGAGFISPYYYFSGKKIKREAEDTFSFEEGSYTACDQVIPDWRLEAKRGRIQMEHYATLTHTLFYANRVPIFYVPYAIIPVKTKRATGFLLPDMGVSDRTGYFIRNAFFWAPANWLDLTFDADYFTKLGFGGGGQLRAALSKEDFLQVSSFFIREQAETNDDRWEVAGNLEHNLPLEFKGSGELNLTSDKDYYRDYAHRNVKGQGWKKVNVEEKWKDEQRSYYSLTRNWDRLGFNNTVEYTRDVSNRFELADQQLLDYEQTIWKYPDFSLALPPQRIPYTPLFFQMDSGYLNYEKKTERDFPSQLEEKILRNERLDTHPQISLPWSPAPYLTLTPKAGIRESWWKEDEEKTNHNRTVYDLGALLEGPEVYRVFQRKKGDVVSKYKHLIRPAVEYQYIPNQDQTNIIQFDEADIIPPANKVNLSLTQELLYKEETGRSSGDVLDLVTFKVSETYNIREERRHHRLIQDKKQPWEPLELELETRLWDYVFIDADLKYNLYHLQVDSRNYGIKLADPGLWHIAANQRWKRDRNYSRTLGRSQSTFNDNFQAEAGINIWNKLLFNGSGVYNFEDDFWVEQEYSLEWRSQCWSFNVTFLRNYTAEADSTEEDNFVVEREDVFYFNLNLFSLDTIHFY
jgi:LPS-assembly protein